LFLASGEARDGRSGATSLGSGYGAERSGDVNVVAGDSRMKGGKIEIVAGRISGRGGGERPASPGEGGAVLIAAGGATQDSGSDALGGNVTIRAGFGVGGSAGSLTLRAGAVLADPTQLSNGGMLDILAGDSVALNGRGGDTRLIGGSGSEAGSIRITGGTAFGSKMHGGNITILSGRSTGTSSSTGSVIIGSSTSSDLRSKAKRDSGNVAVSTGKTTVGNSGDLELVTGATESGSTGNTVIGAGMAIRGSGGSVSVIAGSTTDPKFDDERGGQVSIRGGSGMIGGAVEVVAGNSVKAPGSNVVLTSGKSAVGDSGVV